MVVGAQRGSLSAVETGVQCAGTARGSAQAGWMRLRREQMGGMHSRALRMDKKGQDLVASAAIGQCRSGRGCRFLMR